MTAMLDTITGEISGSKGGSSKPKAPYEAPDSLRSIAKAKILLALGEGEFRGELDGTRIFLDGTPLIDASGNHNFPGVAWEFRPGSQEQTYIKGMPAVENDIAVGVELRSGTPWVRAITNSQLSAARVRLRWPGLQRQKDNGDVVGYSIEYAIDIATDGGAYQEVLKTAVTGKTTTAYERSHRVDLPEGSSWQIRVRRLTQNQSTVRVADTMLIQAVAEVIDRKMRYPNTALLLVEFDAEQFQNIPQVSCEPYGRMIRVPANYDPQTRQYTGAWDGSFKLAWTDNPAWISYDVLLNARFGAGRRITAAQVDHWEIYRIAQYCDQLVTDGKGGMEPRYICDIYIQSQEEAWTVLRDLAAIYRGMTYWAGGQMVSVADMPADVGFVYTRANVIDGNFTYGSGSEKVRYTRALVSFDNPENGYESDTTAVHDQKLMRRYGDNKIELAAIGCTRESEAQRRGKWAILTNSADRSLSFQVGLDGRIPLPGMIIGVADNLLAGRDLGGRISHATRTVVTLDRDALVRKGDRLIVNLPTGKAEGRTVESADGRAVTVSVAYSELPHPESQYVIDAEDLAAQQYRVLSVVRPSDTTYAISAIQHDPSKFAHIDSGARLVERPISVIPIGAQEPPATVLISQNILVEQTMAVTTMTIAWDAAPGAVAYEAEWRKDSGDWIRVPRTGGLSVDVKGVYTGQYRARVRSVSAMDVQSIPRESILTDITGKEGMPPAQAYLTATSIIFGIELAWGFPEDSDDTLYTQIEYNAGPQESGAMHLGDYAYPVDTHTMAGLGAAKVFYFRARLVDRTGNIGPWSDWVMGQSSADADEILDYIAGQISETELAEDLRAPIALIPDLVTGVNQNAQDIAQEVTDRAAEVEAESLARQQAIAQEAASRIAAVQAESQARQQAISAEATARANAIQAEADTRQQNIEDTNAALQTAADELDARMDSLQAEVADVIGAAEYEPSTDYIGGTVIKFEGKLWRATDDILRGNPPPYALWEQIGNYDSLGEAVAAHSAQISANSNRITQADGRITAQANRTDAVIVRVSAAEGEIDGQALAISNITADVSDIDGRVTAEINRTNALALDVGATSASIASEQQARIDGDSLLAGQIDALSVESGDNSAAILAERQARIDGDEALATDISSVSASALAAQQAADGAASNADEALDGVAANTAAITSESQARAGAVNALAADISAVTAQAGNNAAAILTERQARVDGDDVLASRIDSLDVAAGDLGASVTAEQQARIQGDAALAADILLVSASADAAQQTADGAAGDAAQNAAAITAESTARADADSALAQDIATVTASASDNTAAITAEQQARTDADSALASDISTVSAAAIAAQGSADDAQSAADQAAQDAAAAAGIAESKGKVLIQSSAPAAADRLPQNLWIDTTGEANTPKRWVGGQWQTVTDKTAIDAAAAAALAQQAADAAAGVAAQNTAAITAESTARADADSALAADILLVSAETGGNSAAILAESQARTDGDSALATSINNLASEVGDNAAAIVDEASARADADGALSERVNGVFAQINPPLAGDEDWLAGTEQVMAGVWSEQSARADADMALGQRIDATTAQIGDNRAAIIAEESARVTADEAASTRIDLLSAGYQSNTAAILAESVARVDADESLAQQVTTVAASADAAQGTADDALGDAATAQGAADEALGGVAQNAAAITAESIARADADGALAQQINTVQASASAAEQGVADNTAAIQAEATARADADSALSRQVSTLESAVNDEISSAVQSLQQAVADESGARADDISTVQASVALVDGKADAALQGVADNSSAVQQANQAIADEASARASAIQTVQASVSSVAGDAATAQAAADQAAADAAVAAGIAEGKGRTIIQSATPVAADRKPQNLWIDTTGGANTPKRWNVNKWEAITDKTAVDAAAAAAVAQQSASGASSQAAQAQQAAAAASQEAAAAVGLAEGKGKVIIQSSAPATADRLTQNLWIDTTGGNNTPKRWSGSSWVAVTDKAAKDAANAAANAQQVAASAQQTANSAATQASQASASVQQASQAIADLEGGLSTMWSVKMQVNQRGEYVYAGVGLGIENTPGGLQSQFLVEANRFALLNTINGVATSPFTVENGQTIINSAVIGEASITSAKIQNLAVTTAKIANATITSAKIGDAQITTANIGYAAVDTLQIAGRAVTIPVSYYVAGTMSFSKNAWATVASLSVYSTGQPHQISFAFRATTGYFVHTSDLTPTGYLQGRLLEGDSVVWEGKILSPSRGSRELYPGTQYYTNVESGNFSYMLLRQPGAGTITWELQLYFSADANSQSPTGTALHRYLGSMEVKR